MNKGTVRGKNLGKKNQNDNKFSIFKSYFLSIIN